MILSLKQIADKEGLATTGGLRHAIANGELKAVKVGRDWIVDEKDYQRWVKRGKRGMQYQKKDNKETA